MKVIHIKQPYRKTYSLHISKDGDLVIKTNSTVPKRLLDDLIKKHKVWIDKNIKDFEEQNAKRDSFLIENGQIINLLGKKYSIKFKSSKNKNVKVEFDGDDIVFKLKEENHSSQNDLKNCLIKYLKKSSKDLFIDRVNYFATKYSFAFNNISIKEQKSKWGSCSSKRNLNFNWRLIFAPMEVLDYVVVHEVCHLKEMNHSQRFWDLVKIECPNYKNYRKWLRANAQSVRIL